MVVSHFAELPRQEIPVNTVETSQGNRWFGQDLNRTPCLSNTNQIVLYVASFGTFCLLCSLIWFYLLIKLEGTSGKR